MPQESGNSELTLEGSRTDIPGSGNKIWKKTQQKQGRAKELHDASRAKLEHRNP